MGILDLCALENNESIATFTLVEFFRLSDVRALPASKRRTPNAER
jgi:hypothetical protein